MPSFLLGIIIGAAVVGLWAFIRPRPADRIVVDDDVIEKEVLRAAEEEVGEWGADVTPQEAAEETPDWGPGAPKP